MKRCPKCGAPILPCCGKCPREGHGESCSSEEDRKIRERLEKQAIADLLQNECPTCEGRGGVLENDMQGDGVWMTPVSYLADCPDCLGSDKCPGCMQPIEPAYADIDDWTCPLCGWHISWDSMQPGVLG